MKPPPFQPGSLLQSIQTILELLPDLEQHPKALLAEWAADCAEQALPHFEQVYPNDPRPRLALQATRNWIQGKTRFTPVRAAALATHAAARESTSPSATAAARAAGHAAGTAHSLRHAKGAAAYALLSLILSPDCTQQEIDTTLQSQVEGFQKKWQRLKE